MTAHPISPGMDSYLVTNAILKFHDVKFSVCITNISDYKTTGKFTCEHEGLYLISASVKSISNGARYDITLNGTDISTTSIGQHDGYNSFTGAVTITRMLNPNDQIWLYAHGSWLVSDGLYSKLTIIKIK